MIKRLHGRNNLRQNTPRRHHEAARSGRGFKRISVKEIHLPLHQGKHRNTLESQALHCQRNEQFCTFLCTFMIFCPQANIITHNKKPQTQHLQGLRLQVGLVGLEPMTSTMSTESILYTFDNFSLYQNRLIVAYDSDLYLHFIVQYCHILAQASKLTM